MLQKIFFGPPGCGKSYRVRQEAKRLGIEENSPHMIETTFHPEYSYGDFVAKLLPQAVPCTVAYTLGKPTHELDGATLTQTTNSTSIEYRIHAGPLIKALVRAYAIPEQNVLLTIDEINRGNCAQIFGDIFQLLDRREDGWSQYGINLNKLIQDAMEYELGNGKRLENLPPNVHDVLKIKGGDGYKLRLPPNFSLLATMNTSDESVYYMDTAFKRRWDFQYMGWQGGSETLNWHKDAKIDGTDYIWYDFLEKLNAFVAAEFKGRNVDDKQVGVWFLKVPHLSLLITLKGLLDKKLAAEWKEFFPNVRTFDKSPVNLSSASVKIDFEKHGITWPEAATNSKPEELAATLISHIGELKVPREAIKNKLMFFLWDNVFSRSHEPLQRLLKDSGSSKAPPRTFGEFVSEDNVTAFIEGVMTWFKTAEASG